MMKLVKVKNCSDRVTAGQIQQRLREQGIESILESSSVGMFGIAGAVTNQNTDVYVYEEQAGEARTIIEDLFGEAA